MYNTSIGRDHVHNDTSSPYSHEIGIAKSLIVKKSSYTNV